MPGFALPFAVRIVRSWWLREAAVHLECARLCPPGANHVDFGDCRPWHLGQASQARFYGGHVRRRWLESGLLTSPGPALERRSFRRQSWAWLNRTQRFTARVITVSPAGTLTTIA